MILALRIVGIVVGVAGELISLAALGLGVWGIGSMFRGAA
jgi:hypothetical protein